MHRAALPFRAAGGLPVKLGDHGAEIAPFGRVASMAPIREEYDVGRPQRAADGNGNRFLSDRKMHRTLDFVSWIDTRDLFLHATDPVQLPEEARRERWTGPSAERHGLTCRSRNGPIGCSARARSASA